MTKLYCILFLAKIYGGNCMKNFKIILIVVIILTVSLSLFAQEKSKERIAKEYLATGDSLFTAKNFTKSIESYRNSLNTFNDAKTDLTPFTEEIKGINFKLYAAGLNAKNYEVATQYGEAYLTYDPANEAVVKNLAQVYRIALKNIQKAISLWKNYDDKYNSFTAKQEIAELYSKNKDTSNAILWYNKALEMNKDADVLQKIASLYIDNKQPEKAIKTYQDFISTNPSQRDLGKTYRNMGTLYKDINDNANAIKYYELALNINWDRNIALWLVMQYYDSNGYSNANKHIAIMLERNSKDNDAIYYKALILYNQENLTEAKTYFEKIKNHPSYGQSAQGYIKSIDSEN